MLKGNLGVLEQKMGSLVMECQSVLSYLQNVRQAQEVVDFTTLMDTKAFGKIDFSGIQTAVGDAKVVYQSTEIIEIPTDPVL